MKRPTKISDLPDEELRRLLSAAEAVAGKNSSGAAIFRKELERREQRREATNAAS